MSKKLSINQKTVMELFSDRNSHFTIPDYQRPYAWEENECDTLWNDIYSFALPDNDFSSFDETDEYFLGPIVVFRDADKKLKVIDGQQRLTTLMLLLRAFYKAYGNDMQDSRSLTVKRNIEQCLWKTNEFYEPDMSALKIDSEVATDNDKNEFVQILLNGDAPKAMESRYAVNYRFFEDKIKDFKTRTPDYFSHLPTRILGNCILLPIEAESQDTALRIFSTLNDRGKPLSDSDIFKAQLYKAFDKDGKKTFFISQWKQLENICERIFKSSSDNPTDEIFTRYMYFVRAKRGLGAVTLEGLRKFYEAGNYELLSKDHEQTFTDLMLLADFWDDVISQESRRFSERVLRRLFVLRYAPNSMWTYIVSVYFMQNKDAEGGLDDEKFYSFLNKITAFIWAYTIVSPGITALRTPIFNEMTNIVRKGSIDLSSYTFNGSELRKYIYAFSFSNNKPITRAMLAWYALSNEHQKLPLIETIFETEHIYAKNRYPIPDNIEALGNKSLLEKRVNIRAADYRFSDKAKYYLGLIPRKQGTIIHELTELANTRRDFDEQDIEKRNTKIIEDFLRFVEDNNLIKKPQKSVS